MVLYFDLFDLENFRFGSQKLQQTPPSFTTNVDESVVFSYSTLHLIPASSSIAFRLLLAVSVPLVTFPVQELSEILPNDSIENLSPDIHRRNHLLGSRGTTTAAMVFVWAFRARASQDRGRPPCLRDPERMQEMAASEFEAADYVEIPVEPDRVNHNQIRKIGSRSLPGG